MDDLISRRKLLNTFDNKGIQIMLDIPVEEILGEDVDIDDFTMLVQDAIQAYKEMVIDTIKNQPTAYNMDKVVDELQKIEEHCLEMNDWQGQSAVVDAIEIVKQVGVSDDVCEWKKRAKTYDWEPSCEPNSTYNVAGIGWFKYCPYCGKKIKVVG